MAKKCKGFLKYVEFFDTYFVLKTTFKTKEVSYSEIEYIEISLAKYKNGSISRGYTQLMDSKVKLRDKNMGILLSFIQLNEQAFKGLYWFAKRLWN